MPIKRSDTVNVLIDSQRVRRFCIKAQSRLDRSLEALIASQYLGYHSPKEKTKPMDEERKAGKKIFARAQQIRKLLEKEPDKQAVVAAEVAAAYGVLGPLVQTNAKGREVWDKLRLGHEETMRQLARRLPAAVWVRGIKGFGDLGFAIIIGEAGDLSNYATVARLWKRLGLAVIDGWRQGGPPEGATAEVWIQHSYNPRRRAEVWSLADSLFKHQWVGDKDEDGKNPAETGKPVAIEAHAVGPYGEYYGRKKAEYIMREWTPKHADNAARRYMTKCLIRDLWSAWRAATRAEEGRMVEQEGRRVIE